MKTQVTINGITQEIELTEEQRKLFEPEVEYGRVDCDKAYYFVRDNGEINVDFEAKDEESDKFFNCGNYFLTKEEAELEAKITSLRRRMKRFSDEHGGDYEWNGENEHYYIYYNNKANVFGYESSFYFRILGKIYFNSREVTRLAIEKFGDEIRELYELSK